MTIDCSHPGPDDIKVRTLTKSGPGWYGVDSGSLAASASQTGEEIIAAHKRSAKETGQPA